MSRPTIRRISDRTHTGGESFDETRRLNPLTDRLHQLMNQFFAMLAAFAVSTAALEAAPYEIAVIPMGATHQYWKSLYAGTLKAKRELAAAGTDVDIIWKGPLREDDRDQQIQVVENFIGRQVSGIVLAPLDAHALVAPVEEAAEAGIPTVIVDSALASDKIVSLVATDNREGGRIAARRLGTILGGKGKAAMLRNQVGAASTEEREAGFLEVMRKDFPGVQLVSSDQHAGVTRDTAKTAAENLLNRFGNELNGIFTSNEASTAGMLLALRDAGLAGGKIKFVGFDSGDLLINGLKTGDLQGLVLQNPVNMGYLGVKLLVASIKGQKVPKFIDTGAKMITPENMTEPALAELLQPIQE